MTLWWQIDIDSNLTLLSGPRLSTGCVDVDDRASIEKLRKLLCSRESWPFKEALVLSSCCVMDDDELFIKLKYNKKRSQKWFEPIDYSSSADKNIVNLTWAGTLSKLWQLVIHC